MKPQKNKRRPTKDFSFARYFNSGVTPMLNGLGFRIPKHIRKIGRMVWNSKRNGTHVKAIHGVLK